ncbi:MAG: hypothetical protein HYV37_03550 [Candidatus Levyibacteriota bacterium]|nr:MAG: hypothetical protein HYV37_03550 [Candidatus Levybacteria bacterium]
MIVFRRRLLYWLIREYIRKWGKTIIVSFVVGLLAFFVLLTFLKYLIPKIPIGRNESIGITGAYTLESLPSYILADISKGLTEISQDKKPIPAIAKQWKIDNDGKKYTFFLKDNTLFSDGTRVSSDAISYRFSDVKVSRPSKQTVIFELKDAYSPFLVSVSRPIFKKGFIGIGPYIVKDVKVNGNFIQTIILAVKNNPYKTKTYQFYPTLDALKIAYMLGEVSQIRGLPNVSYKDMQLDRFPNTKATKTTNYEQLVTLFYNTKDSVLSDKRLRSALSYAIPDVFSQGERAYGPISPKSWAFSENFTLSYDIEQAKILLSSSDIGTKSADFKLEIKTLPRYEQTAKDVLSAWKKIGIESKIVVVDSIPSKFQIFLGNFYLPKDPDQYTLWHSNQTNNITHFENKRIDKLLEDGRKLGNIEERGKIYADFQKYLLADSPATFLYFPYEYELLRK